MTIDKTDLVWIQNAYANNNFHYEGGIKLLEMILQLTPNDNYAKNELVRLLKFREDRNLFIESLVMNIDCEHLNLKIQNADARIRGYSIVVE